VWKWYAFACCGIFGKSVNDSILAKTRPSQKKKAPIEVLKNTYNLIFQRLT